MDDDADLRAAGRNTSGSDRPPPHRILYHIFAIYQHKGNARATTTIINTLRYNTVVYDDDDDDANASHVSEKVIS